MAEHYTSFSRDDTRWLLQRVTAVFLVGVLAFHFMLLHFVHHAYEITLAGTTARMSQPGYFVTMVSFLIAGTFHGVNGVYNALVNQGIEGTPRTIVKYGLIIVSLLLIAQGIRVAWVMTGGQLV
ncbi:succinate dehydrogenase hydrophobic membrane anchor subunit [Halocatena salina]|uniref:Succinate dehydrogenase hydrophobic membrane anchor subunit n=1 Tax=Halocatena salina TaxID=2934340 RepID=A0A8U0A4X7_9EURY|nr:succinate dehydrogenase hydrophobic membrane anchor subunit [Halocatena salina]UPM43518.1 succinate dehydrogenase hydrophobic membrane anchor subunit [Halocatena salina]